MRLKYNLEQHREYFEMINRIGMKWLDIFEGNTEFYATPYWDLLTNIWYAGGSIRKTDALKLMKSIKSAHTAGKYVETAIGHGFLQEADNPKDARSKLVMLAPEMRERLDTFFDVAVSELRKSNRVIDVKGPTPDSP